MATDLWHDGDAARWKRALASYPDVVAAQGVERLVELDEWYRGELPSLIAARKPRTILHDELVRIVEWKMKRGEWRARNLVLVKANDWDAVKQVVAEGIEAAPHPTKPIRTIATLGGVGPATASAVVAAAVPEHYPFFDELVAAQVPSLGPVAWTLGYYAKYAAALNERAQELGGGWTPVDVERALWAESGGKVALAAG